MTTPEEEKILSQLRAREANPEAKPPTSHDIAFTLKGSYPTKAYQDKTGRRLKSLTVKGYVTREREKTLPYEYRYRLTEAGRSSARIADVQAPPPAPADGIEPEKPAEKDGVSYVDVSAFAGQTEGATRG